MTYPREPSERSKGTLFGLVLGLIVGLAIAVLAALYITHSPKPQPRKEESSAGQASKMDAIQKLELQLREPKQLDQSTPSTTAAEQQIHEPTEEFDEPQIMEVPPAAPATVISQAPKRANPSRSAAPTPTKSTGYYLQTGAYKTRAGAEQQHARLALQGFSSKVTQHTAGSVTYYRVRLGPFTQPSDVSAVRTQLSDAGVDAIIVQDVK